MIVLNVVPDLTCPKCKSPEVSADKTTLNIRAFKVCDDNGRWWSHCLVCSEKKGKPVWFAD